MNARSRPTAGLWPQKIRTRLTLSYAGLFLLAGSALLALTYGLLAASLPSSPSASLTISQPERDLLQACQAAGVADQGAAPIPSAPGAPGPVPLKQLSVCKQAEGAYRAGTAAGMQAQRQNTLGKLLGFAVVGLAVMTFASGGLGWYMSGRVLRPVRVITETARRASEQHLAGSSPTPRMSCGRR